MLFDSEQATSPNPPLRARTVMELLDATFRTYRENFAAFFALSSIVIIVTTVLNALLSGSLPTTSFNSSLSRGSTMTASTSLQICMVALFVIVLALAQSAILNGVFTVMTSERQFGRRLSLGEAWAMASPRLAPLAGAYGLFYLGMGALLFATTFAVAICGILIILFAFVAYLAITVNAFIAPIYVLEGGRGAAVTVDPRNPTRYVRVGGGASLARAYKLAKPRFWQIVILSGLILVITAIIQVAFAAVVSALFLSNARTAASSTGQIINLILTMVLNIIVAPLIPVAMTLLYYDTRIRKEGLDLALQTVGPDARPGDVPPPITGEPSFTTQDFVNMGVIVGIVVLLVVVFQVALAPLFNALLPGLSSLPLP